MCKVLKWIGIIFGGLIGLLLVAVVFVTFSSNSRVNKTYNIPPDDVTVHNNGLPSLRRACSLPRRRR